MRTNSFKATSIAAVLVVASIAAYWYWSPFLAIRQLQNAAQAQDADAFNEKVDYPKLRESVKGQLSAMMAEQVGSSSDAGGFAALGTAMALALVNPMVDAFIRPESVMQAMQNGKLSRQSPPQSNPEQQGDPAAVNKKPKLFFERKNVDKLIAYVPASDNAEAKSENNLGLVFERSGFANWKLTELRMPALNKQQ